MTSNPASVGPAPHDWGPSTVGHGENQCRRCYITNREAWALGTMNECSKPPESEAPHPDREAEPTGGVDLIAIAKVASEGVAKNTGIVPQMAFAPILFALQDALSVSPPVVEGSSAEGADTQPGADGAVVEPSDAMCDAARGLIMMDRFGLPNAKTPLSECARSGFYGEHWAHVLDDDERNIAHRLPKGHLASLIWRAMESARQSPTEGHEAAVVGPGGWLVKDFADGWYWTGDRLSADMAANGGARVYSVESGEYETATPAPSDTSEGTACALSDVPQTQAHSEIEPDGRPSARPHQESRSGREIGRRDEVRTSGAERRECDHRTRQPEVLTSDGAGNVPAPSAAVSAAEQVGIFALRENEPKARHQPTTPGEQEVFPRRVVVKPERLMIPGEQGEEGA